MLVAFGHCAGVGGFDRAALRQGPAARVGDAEQGAAAAAAAATGSRSLAGRHQQGAQAGEAVGVHAALGHEFGQGVFQLGLQQARAVEQFVEERGAVLRQPVGHVLRA